MNPHAALRWQKNPTELRRGRGGILQGAESDSRAARRETAGHTRSCPIGTTSRAESIRASEVNELRMRGGGECEGGGGETES